MARKRATGPPEPESTIELVTPEMARNWLGERIRTRNMRVTKVSEYALDMKEGRWHVAAALVFNVDGRLIDGQHRLEAVVEYGESVLFNVVRNAVPEALLVVDTGIKRLLADFLRIRKASNASDIAVLIRTMWRWDAYKTFKDVPKVHKGPTTQQAITYYDEHGETLDEAALFARAFSPPTFITRSVVGGLHILFSDIDSEEDKKFWRLIANGAEGASAIVALQRRLKDNYTKREKLPSWYTAALVIKTWNFWLEGTEIKILKFRPGGTRNERFPMPMQR
jgi:hypothetical protein